MMYLRMHVCVFYLLLLRNLNLIIYGVESSKPNVSGIHTYLRPL